MTNLAIFPLASVKNSDIEGAIIDKNVRMDKDVTIRPSLRTEIEREDYTVKDGIVVIPKTDSFTRRHLHWSRCLRSQLTQTEVVHQETTSVSNKSSSL